MWISFSKNNLHTCSILIMNNNYIIIIFYTVIVAYITTMETTFAFNFDLC